MPLSDPPLAAQRPLACKELKMDYAAMPGNAASTWLHTIMPFSWKRTSRIQSCNVAIPQGWYQVHPLKLGAQGTRATQSKRSVTAEPFSLRVWNFVLVLFKFQSANMCRKHQCSRTDQPQLQKTWNSLRRTIGAFTVYLCLPMCTYTFTCQLLIQRWCPVYPTTFFC